MRLPAAAVLAVFTALVVVVVALVGLSLADAVSIDGTVALWAGLCVQFVLRRGQPHREVLFATAGLAVAITMVLPPVAAVMPTISGSSGPCSLFQNIWGVLSSGLIVLVIAVGRGRAAILAAATATGVLMLVEWWLGEVTRPSPVGCVTLAPVSSTSLFWWLMIVWHLLARAAVLAVCVRDAVALRGDSWAQSGVWWYTIGFAASTLFWMLSGAVLVTRRHWPELTVLRTDVLTGTVVAVTVAVWWSVAQRAVVYGLDVAEFWSLYRGLPAAGWSVRDRRALWKDSLRGWAVAPHRAAYRVRLAQADHRIDALTGSRREGEL